MNLPKTGVPYAFPSDPPRTFDCWTLMVHIRSELGLWTPPVDTSWSPPAIAEAIDYERRHWRQVPEPQSGDVALISNEHLGVYLEGFIAHASATTGVLYTPARVLQRVSPNLRYYRPCQ